MEKLAQTILLASQSLRKSGQFFLQKDKTLFGLIQGRNPFVNQVNSFEKERKMNLPKNDESRNPFVNQVNSFL